MSLEKESILRRYQITVKVYDTESRHKYVVYEDDNDILTAIDKALDSTVERCVNHPVDGCGTTVVSNGKVTYVDNID